MKQKLTNEQIDQIDFLHNIVYEAVARILDACPPWDMEWIGPLADHLVRICVDRFGEDEDKLYPGISHELDLDNVRPKVATEIHKYINLGKS